MHNDTPETDSTANDTANASPPGSEGRLTLYIIIALVAAVGTALLVPGHAARLNIGGEIFLRALKMLVVPLVVASVMNGILGMGDIRKLGRPGGVAVLYYLSTTLLAVIVGLLLVNIIKPGAGLEPADMATGPQAETVLIDALAQDTGLERREIARVFPQLEGGLEESQPSVWTIVSNLALMLFTDNLFKAAANADLLPLIIFSILFAGILTTLGTRVKTIVQVVEQVNEALMSFIMLLMKVAPFGIYCLVAARFGEALDKGEFFVELQRTGSYSLTVLLGLSVHAFVTLPLILWATRRMNPFRFMYHMSQAILTAFSTASSSATLPVTMECAHEKAGISKKSTDFVLPLGATINMDGTALYEAVAAIFIAQVIGLELTFAQQVTVAVTATLAAIGAAGIPQAGLVTMIIVLNAVGLPTEYITLILTVDWLLDRFRTAVNVLGDSIGAAVVEPSFGS